MARLKNLVDELGELNERLTPAKMAIAKDTERVKILEDAIRAEVKELPADKPEIFEGAKYGCKVGAVRNETIILSTYDAACAVKAAGGRVWKLFAITLEKLKTAVGPEKFAALTETGRTGRRDLDTFRLVK